ncbi:hypothetical protein DFH07DRAFT_958865 [Mycena maculata]|uniref:F-box domain-containing protein n=1 Tax=Mycena maculata TaxID=230809 RepID=A0AAD7NDE3_9AGAR|nr:hypothetical protein DFH07DRAFT_958865 [Mycena maculata]
MEYAAAHPVSQPTSRELPLQLINRLDAYTYPVLTLPNEIISEIFIHFLPVYPKRPPIIGSQSPILLGKISRKWRDIAFSTPALWRALASILRQGELGQQQLCLLKIFLSRSGSCTLSIKLELGGTETQLAGAFLQEIISHSTRWEHLDLHVRQHSLRSIEGPLSAPSLRSLKLASPDVDEDGTAPTTAFLAAPLPHTIHLQVCDQNFYSIFHGPQLTTLNVRMIAPQECAALLNLTPQLVHCKLLMNGAEDSSLSREINLPCLKTLGLGLLNESAPFHEYRIIDMLVLPALRQLYIEEEFLRPDPVSRLASFVSRSRCNLQELHIPESTVSVSSDLFRTAVPSLVVSVIFCEDYFLEVWGHEESWTRGHRKSADGRSSCDDGGPYSRTVETNSHPQEGTVAGLKYPLLSPVISGPFSLSSTLATFILTECVMNFQSTRTRFQVSSGRWKHQPWCFPPGSTFHRRRHADRPVLSLHLRSSSSVRGPAPDASSHNPAPPALSTRLVSSSRMSRGLQMESCPRLHLSVSQLLSMDVRSVSLLPRSYCRLGTLSHTR